MESLGTITLVGIAIVLIVDRVMAQLKARGCDLQKMNRQIEDMYDWHCKEDSDGVKVWYVRRSLEDAIKGLTKAIAVQTEAITALVGTIAVMQGDVKHLETEIRECQERHSNSP